jgi:threonine dehydratase
MSKIAVFADVESAAKNILKEAVKTPLLYLRKLSEKMAAIIFLKAENLQHVRRSLEKGKIIKNTRTSGSVCDALLSLCAGEITYGIMEENLSGVLTISDQKALRAVKDAWEHLKLVLEPSGAAALAAILSGKMDIKNKNIVIMLSGGNIDKKLFEKTLKIEL